MIQLTTQDPRPALLSRALKLEYLTVGWNLVEGVIAVAAAISAGSIALLGFGIDSFVESASGGVLIWRLKAERATMDACAISALDRKAQRLVGLSLFLLAAYISFDAASALWTGERPSPSNVGLVLTTVSMFVMGRLARAKKTLAAALNSRALEADSFQTTACWWLSVTTLIGAGLNALAGWWWADPVAALVMVLFIVSEARNAWRGEACCG